MNPLYFFCTLLFCSTFVKGYNIDVHHVQYTYADNGEFGYSVDFVKFESGCINQQCGYLLVGAPSSKFNTFKKYYSKSGRYGALYKCDKEDCVALSLDNNIMDEYEDLYRNFNNSRFGHTLISRARYGDPSFITCAPWFLQAGVSNIMTNVGVCLSLKLKGQNEMEFETIYTPPSDNLLLGFSAAISKDMRQPWMSLLGDSRHWLFKGGALFGGNALLTSTVQQSYAGFAVTVGHFFDSLSNDVAMAAPRAVYKGQVWIIPALNYSYPETISALKFPGNAVQVLSGSLFTEYFGYSLATLDVNGDGWSDIAVGAPFYRQSLMNENGAVYVFLHSGRKTATPFLSDKYTLLTGEGHLSGFGMTVENGGDLDRDGHEDLVIGAPFHSFKDYEASGAVFIYMGSKYGIDASRYQVLYAKDFTKNRKLYGFGMSVAGAFDINANKFPDLAVGAFQSNAAVTFSSSTVIFLKHEYTFTNNDVPIVADVLDQSKLLVCPTNKKFVCLKMKLCIRLANFDFHSFQQLNLEVETLFDVGMTKLKRPSRIFSYREDKPLSLLKTPFHILNRDACSEYPLAIKSNLTDKYRPLEFVSNVKISDAFNGIPPVLSRSSSKFTKVLYLKTLCADYHGCITKLVLSASFVPSHSVKMVSDTDANVLLGSSDDIEIMVNVTVENDAAYESELIFDSNLLETPSDCLKKKCLLGNPFISPNHRSYVVKVDKTLLFLYKRSTITFPMHIQTASNCTEDSILNVSLSATIYQSVDLKVSATSKPSQVIFGGRVVGAFTLLKQGVRGIGPQANYTFDVINNGPESVNSTSAAILIHIPQSLLNGKLLLYSMRPIWSESGRVNCKVLYGNSSDPLGFLNRTTRSKRSAAALRARNKADLIIDCNLGNANCITYQCALPAMEKGSSIKFNLETRVWNATFIEDFPRKIVQVVAHCSIKFLVPFLADHFVFNDEDSASTLVRPDVNLFQQQRPIDWWIIPLSVIGGLFLFALLVLIFWRAGFFKRQRAEDKWRKQRTQNQYQFTHNYDYRDNLTSTDYTGGNSMQASTSSFLKNSPAHQTYNGNMSDSYA